MSHTLFHRQEDSPEILQVESHNSGQLTVNEVTSQGNDVIKIETESNPVLWRKD